MRPPGSPRTGVPGRLEYERAAGERPPRARPQRRGSPGPIPNPAVKPAFAESTAAQGCGRAGRRARGGRFSIGAERGPRGEVPPAGLFAFRGALPAGRRDRRCGPPTLPAFAASGACAPREWMDFFVYADGVAIAPVYEVDPKSWTVENEIGTGRKHSEEKLFRVLFCLGK